MLNKYIVLIIFVLVSLSSQAKLDQTEPMQLAQNITNKLFARIKNEQAQLKSNPEHMVTIVNEELVPYTRPLYPLARKFISGYPSKEETRAKLLKLRKSGAFRNFRASSFAYSLMMQSNLKSLRINQGTSSKRRHNTNITFSGANDTRISMHLSLNSKKKLWYISKIITSVNGIKVSPFHLIFAGGHEKRLFQDLVDEHSSLITAFNIKSKEINQSLAKTLYFKALSNHSKVN